LSSVGFAGSVPSSSEEQELKIKVAASRKMFKKLFFFHFIEF